MTRMLAEFVGTAGLLVVVVGSGIMGEALAAGNEAIALLANSLATGAGLYALIVAFSGVSGAHFNPAVSLTERMSGNLKGGELAGYLAAQTLGAITGVMLTHFMFGQALIQSSKRGRSDPRLLVSEAIATFGLITVAGLSGKKAPSAVALFITSAYWCTSSTSFANPAVTLARSLTDTFAGIQIHGVPGFVAAQVAGAVLAHFFLLKLNAPKAQRPG